MGRNHRLLVICAVLLAGVVLLVAFQNFSAVQLPSDDSRCYGQQFRQTEKINKKVNLQRTGIDPMTVKQYFPEIDPHRMNPVPADFDSAKGVVTLKSPGAPGALVELRYCDDKSVALAPKPSR